MWQRIRRSVKSFMLLFGTSLLVERARMDRERLTLQFMLAVPITSELTGGEFWQTVVQESARLLAGVRGDHQADEASPGGMGVVCDRGVCAPCFLTSPDYGWTMDSGRFTTAQEWRGSSIKSYKVKMCAIVTELRL